MAALSSFEFDPSIAKGDFLEASDALTLTLLYGADIFARFQQRSRRARVKPGETAPEPPNAEVAARRDRLC